MTSISTSTEQKSSPVELKIKNEITPKLVWSDQTEELLIRWADNASCYKWLHDRSYRRFKFLNYMFSIPVIILSTVTGSMNFAISSFVPLQYIDYAQIGIGVTNIFTGIITTLLNFFRYAQSSESHFNASIGWSKLHRNISNELSLEREHRKDANTFIKMCRNDYDRLIEQSPIIPMGIINSFRNKFNTIKDIYLPDTCGTLSHTTVYRARTNFDSISQVINSVKTLNGKKSKKNNSNSSLSEIVIKIDSDVIDSGENTSRDDPITEESQL